MILQIIAVIGILIPVSGIFALIINNQYSENTLRLMLTNIGCLIMNSGYFLILLSNSGLGTQFDPVLGRLFSECRPELEKLYNNMA